MGIFKTIYDIVIDIATKAGTALEHFEALCMVAGVGLALILFLVFWIASTGGYVGKMNKAVKKANKALLAVEAIDDDNVEAFTAQYFAKMPETVKFGWECFLANSYGYPSEFITEYDCVRVPSVKYKKRTALTWYLFIMVIFIGLTRIVCYAADLATLDPVVVFGLPALFTAVFAFILNFIYNGKEVKLFKRFLQFQMLLDSKVELESDAECTDACELEPVEGLVVEPVVEPEEIAVEPAAPVVVDRMQAFVEKIDAVCASDASVVTLQNILSKLTARIERSSVGEADKATLEACAKKLEDTIALRK